MLALEVRANIVALHVARHALWVLVGGNVRVSELTASGACRGNEGLDDLKVRRGACKLASDFCLFVAERPHLHDFCR